MSIVPPRITAAGRGYSLLVIIANIAALAILAAVTTISPLPRSCSAIAGMARDCAALLVIFFVPGTALVLSFSRRERIPLFDLLALGFAVNVVLLTVSTTALKLAGGTVGRGAICAVAGMALAPALLATARARRLPVVRNDLRLPLPLLLAAVASFPLLFALLRGYTLLGPDAHWLVEQVRPLLASGPGADAAVVERRYEGTDLVRGGPFLTLARGSSSLAITNPSGRASSVRLRYLVSAGGPGVFTISARGVEDRFPVPQPFLERGSEVRFRNQAAVSDDLTLPPGETLVTLKFRDGAERAAPCTLLDATGMTDREFLDAFARRYRFVNFVLMYDIMEANDFVANLLWKPYLYHSPGTPEAPGYAVTNPPMSYLFASFGYALMGGTMGAINKVAFAVLMAEFFAALFLMHRGLSRADASSSSALLLGVLSLATLLTMGVSLHFMTHFMFLCFLCACVFLLQGRALPCFAFCLICCGSAWAGCYFCALALACYAVLRGELRRPLLLLSAVAACMVVYLALLLAVGRAKGMLPAWTETILWENFRRFGSAHLYQAGAKRAFFAGCLPGTALLPLGLLLRRDRESWFFLLFSAAYLATLLAAPSNEWKIHYLPTVCLPLMIAGGRSLALARAEADQAWRVRAVTGIVLAGAAAGFAYLLSLCLRGALI